MTTGVQELTQTETRREAATPREGVPPSMRLVFIVAVSTLLVAWLVAHRDPQHAPPFVPALTATKEVSGVEFTIDGIRVVGVGIDHNRDSVADDWFYFWHPNATDFTVVEKVEVDAVAPVIICDVSPSMGQYGYLEPAKRAVAAAASEFRRLGEAQAHANQGVNVMQDPTLILFSRDAAFASFALPIEPTETDYARTNATFTDVMQRSAVAATVPEAAFRLLVDLLQSRRSLFPVKAFVPIVFLTDGQFNGGIQYKEHWKGVARELKKLSDEFGIRFSIQMLGMKNDDIQQIVDMYQAFDGHFPVSYLAMTNTDQMSTSFSRAVNLAVTASQVAVKINGSLLHQGDVWLRNTALPHSDAKAWDMKDLFAAEYFSDATLSEEARQAHGATAMKHLLEIRRFVDAIDSRLQEFATRSSSLKLEEVNSTITEIGFAVDTTLKRTEAVMEPFAAKVIRCQEAFPVLFAEGRTLPCGEPDSRVPVNSMVVPWLEQALGELIVSQKALKDTLRHFTASDADQKKRFETVGNVANKDTRLSQVNATLTRTLNVTASATKSTTAYERIKSSVRQMQASADSDSQE